MEYKKPNSHKRSTHRFSASAGALICGAALALSASLANAQQPAAPTQQPAAQPKQANQQTDGWVKLCREMPVVSSKGAASQKTMCLTQHERLSTANGKVLVSAAIRNVSGQEQESVMVTVPLGVALPPGLQAKVDENKPFSLQFTFCHVVGCTAEALATKEVLDTFKKGNQLVVNVINPSGKIVGFPIPLTGFTKAYEGNPVDPKIYQAARVELLKRIRARQIELAKKAAAAKKNEAGQAPAKKQ